MAGVVDVAGVKVSGLGARFLDMIFYIGLLVFKPLFNFLSNLDKFLL